MAVDHFLHDLWISRMTAVIGYTLLWYDYFLTIDDEVKYIWNSPWTGVKVVYLLNRYGILCGQTVVGVQMSGISAEAWQHHCGAYAVFFTIYILFSLESAHHLVLLRAWVVWSGNRQVLKSIVVGYIAVLVSVLAGVTKREKVLDTKLVEGLCYRSVPDFAWSLHFASMVLDTAMYCMAMYSLLTYRRPSPDGFPLFIRVFMRDITAFFVINVFHDAVYIIAWTVYANSVKASVPACIALPVLAICGQRVVIDLRRLKPTSQGSNEISKEVDRQMSAFSRHQHYQLSVIRQCDFNPDGENTWPDSGDDRDEV